MSMAVQSYCRPDRCSRASSIFLWAMALHRLHPVPVVYMPCEDPSDERQPALFVDSPALATLAARMQHLGRQGRNQERERERERAPAQGPVQQDWPGSEARPSLFDVLEL